MTDRSLLDVDGSHASEADIEQMCHPEQSEGSVTDLSLRSR